MKKPRKKAPFLSKMGQNEGCFGAFLSLKIAFNYTFWRTYLKNQLIAKIYKL